MYSDYIWEECKVLFYVQSHVFRKGPLVRENASTDECPFLHDQLTCDCQECQLYGDLGARAPTKKSCGRSASTLQGPLHNLQCLAKHWKSRLRCCSRPCKTLEPDFRCPKASVPLVDIFGTLLLIWIGESVAERAFKRCLEGASHLRNFHLCTWSAGM